MNGVNRLAFIGNSLPRRCGIATFTTDLQQAISAARPALDPWIVAMTDHGADYDYPAVVRHEIRDNVPAAYARAAEAINASDVDVVSLQHEFGIFGGTAGGHISLLLDRLAMPVVTTLHTVLAAPTAEEFDVLDRIVGASAKVVIMAEKGRELLRSVYGVPTEKIEIIPHGIPDVAFAAPDAAKARLGFAGRAVILTFGLLSPNKGIEVMIDAMPAILQSRLDAVYVVLGATHPNLVRQQGETYRESLVARAMERGVAEHVVFLDQFVDRPTLLEFIAMCDVYVTPYLNEAQMTSGTLAYSFGLGKAVVSTPYWHARELLADGRGILVPFGDAASIGAEIAGLLTDDARRLAMRCHAYAAGRSMTWPRTATRYLAAFDEVRRGQRLRLVARKAERPPAGYAGRLPEMRTGHFHAMCDDTGLFQHAIHAVPNRAHGYCVDDNARALLLAGALNGAGERPLSEALTSRLAAFVQHAWNPSNGRFRNFMSFDRQWLEDAGSEDSHGRTLWALGVTALRDASASRRLWATELFAAALPAVEEFGSPRAWAFALLGLDAYCVAVPEDRGALRFRPLLADRLAAIHATIASDDWFWFEDVLGYDNARLSQAMIVSGVALDMPRHVAAGMRTLQWLMAHQTAPAGCFRPVGTDGFGIRLSPPEPFDQQPLEAAASISACLAAWQADGDDAWCCEARRAFDWFLGANDLGLPLVDLETGSCRDGLHRDRLNENRGGESAVSYLLSLAEMRRCARASKFQPQPAAHLRRSRSWAP